MALTGGASARTASSIIDSHIHLFDPARPQGIPWPDKSNAILYHPALPERYQRIAEPLGIKGAIVVEASPRLEDNQWVLDVAAQSPVILGVVGNLDPAAPEFARQVERFQRNPLFRGIRYGNLWNRDLAKAIAQPTFLSAMKALAHAGLSLDTANPNPALLAAVVRLTDQVPALRVVIDHLPQMDWPADSASLRADLSRIGQRPQIYVKVSEVLRRVDGRVPLDLPFYRARLDEITELFGPDRVLYGSDWPNSDQWAAYPEVLRIVQEYFGAKGPTASEKFFWKNSQAAYRWVERPTRTA